MFDIKLKIVSFSENPVNRNFPNCKESHFYKSCKIPIGTVLVTQTMKQALKVTKRLNLSFPKTKQGLRQVKKKIKLK